MNKISEKGLREIISHEGFRSRAYKCPAGVVTIGIGFTWASVDFRIWWRKNRGPKPFNLKARITRAESEECLKTLIENGYGREVNQFLENKNVPQNVFDAAVSMAFNCGSGSLKWKWGRSTKEGNYKQAATYLRKTAVTANGVKLAGLVRRREDEAMLLENGIYSHTGTNIEMNSGDSNIILHRGTKGMAVAKLIRDLTKLKFYNGVQDDLYGHGTEAAVLAFQRANKLDPDGMAGPATLSAIEEALLNRKINKRALIATPIVAAVGATANYWDKVSAFFTGLF